MLTKIYFVKKFYLSMNKNVYQFWWLRCWLYAAEIAIIQCFGKELDLWKIMNSRSSHQDWNA